MGFQIALQPWINTGTLHNNTGKTDQLDNERVQRIEVLVTKNVHNWEEATRNLTSVV